MRRKRVTGRFYVFVVLLLTGAYFILRELIPEVSQEAIVTMANATLTQTVDAVIMRNEVVTSYEGNGQIVFIASEGQQVVAGDEICEVYSAGYAEREMERLETVRQSIRTYHESILDNIVDQQLDLRERQVEDIALQLKALINNKSGGSLANLEKQLESAMSLRHEYLRQNRRDDLRLNQLYEEEEKRLNAISTWKTVATAPINGQVSFYLDGYEDYLSPANLSSVTIDDLRAVLAGRKPETNTTSRLQTSIFRVVSTDSWYIYLLSRDTTWNPVNDQEYSFQMAGFSDLAFAGTVVQIQKTDSEVMCVIQVQGSMGPLINRRSGTAAIGAYMSGLSVPRRAVATQGNQTGVWLTDDAGGTFIPVEVLSTDDYNALVEPITQGTLYVGQRVKVQ
ncbi:MAG: HlyD family efflux transporter periplasmic adaptor subunit [Clostridia bacterium]|nr:HlyD family efflux transporter periplasmic adaptor subunit [Clostridia bacterium]